MGIIYRLWDHKFFESMSSFLGLSIGQMEEKALVYRLRNPLGFDAFKMGRLPAGLAPTHSTRCRLLRAFGPFDALSLAQGDALPHAARVTWPFEALPHAARCHAPIRRAVACTGHAYPPPLR
jgi:hypothetical protein